MQKKMPKRYGDKLGDRNNTWIEVVESGHMFFVYLQSVQRRGFSMKILLAPNQRQTFYRYELITASDRIKAHYNYGEVKISQVKALLQPSTVYQQNA